MTHTEMATLIEFLIHLEFVLKQLGSYQDAPDPSPVMLTHCGKYHVALNTLAELREMKRWLMAIAKDLPGEEF